MPWTERQVNNLKRKQNRIQECKTMLNKTIINLHGSTRKVLIAIIVLTMFSLLWDILEIIFPQLDSPYWKVFIVVYGLSIIMYELYVHNRDFVSDMLDKTKAVAIYEQAQDSIEVNLEKQDKDFNEYMKRVKLRMRNAKQQANFPTIKHIKYTKTSSFINNIKTVHVEEPNS